METKLIKIDRQNMDAEGIREGAELLRAGRLVAFPTETVYGLGANALDAEACAEIYRVKGRPQDNPLIVHVADLKMVDSLVREWPEAARRCAEKFWPGPLTMVLPKSSAIPASVTGGLDTVAVRFPSHPVAAALIRRAGIPVAAPSANLSGKPSPTMAEHVRLDLDGKIPLILDGGPCTVGLESTVLDVSGEVPAILRPGGVTQENLAELLGPVEVARLREGEKPKSPGMKYRHYAPQARMILFRGNRARLLAAMTERFARARAEGLRVGILCLEESAAELRELDPDFLFVLGSFDRPQEVAARLFAGLRLCDRQRLDLILTEGIEEEGLGAAVMNRMVKAAGHQLVELN